MRKALTARAWLCVSSQGSRIRALLTMARTCSLGRRGHGRGELGGEPEPRAAVWQGASTGQSGRITSQSIWWALKIGSRLLVDLVPVKLGRLGKKNHTQEYFFNLDHLELCQKASHCHRSPTTYHFIPIFSTVRTFITSTSSCSAGALHCSLPLLCPFPISCTMR